MTFWAYMLHCRSGVFYTGHTDDLKRRIGAHKSGLMEGFTQKLQPVELVWSQEFPTRYEALSAERRIKGWSRAKKLALIRGDGAEISRLAKKKSGPSTGSGRTDFDREIPSGAACPLPAERRSPPPHEEPQPELHITTSIIAQLRAEATDACPNEACGLLLGRGETVTRALPAANVHPDPLRHFEIDPIALIAAHKAERAGGPRLIGYYHSHPTGHPLPSATDCAHASADGRIWAIVARDEVRFYRDDNNGFVPLPSRLVDG